MQPGERIVFDGSEESAEEIIEALDGHGYRFLWRWAGESCNAIGYLNESEGREFVVRQGDSIRCDEAGLVLCSEVRL